MNNKITLRNAQIAPYKFRNFEGRETEYNRAGDRNFVVFLDKDTAQALEKEGAPVSWKPDRFNEGELRAQMKIHVKYRDRKGNPMIPPKVVLITKKNQTQLTEETIGMLDQADIEKCDLILSQYENGSTMGPQNSVALKTMYVTLSEDEFAEEYGFAIGEEHAESSEESGVPW